MKHDGDPGNTRLGGEEQVEGGGGVESRILGQ